MSATRSPQDGPESVGTAAVNTRRARARRRFVVATFVDAVGSGLWMPFALLFLVHGQHLPLVSAGAALSAGALLGVATGPLAGTLMDRAGPWAMLILSNLVRLVAFCVYPLVATGWQVTMIAAVVAAGDRLFWTANAPFITLLAGGPSDAADLAGSPVVRRDSERVLGIQTIGRFGGTGLGAAATALLPTVTSPFVYHVLAYLNAASFAVAVALIAGLCRGTHGRMARHADLGADSIKNGARWSVVLRTQGYAAFCATHVIFTLASASKYLILPILVRDVLHAPQWISGIAIALGTVTLVIAQQPVLRLAARWTRGTGLIAAALLFTAGFAALALVTEVPLEIATVIIMAASLVFAVAEAVFAPLATAAAAPPAAQGRASALFQMSWAASQVLAPVLLATLLAAGNVVLWLTLAAVTVVAAPVVLRLRAQLPIGVLR